MATLPPPPIERIMSANKTRKHQTCINAQSMNVQLCTAESRATAVVHDPWTCNAVACRFARGRWMCNYRSMSTFERATVVVRHVERTKMEIKKSIDETKRKKIAQ